MSVAKVIEISSSSETSFEDAIDQGIKRACRSVDNVRGAWIKEQKVSIENGRITKYRVNMQLTFVLDGHDEDDEDDRTMQMAVPNAPCLSPTTCAV